MNHLATDTANSIEKNILLVCDDDNYALSLSSYLAQHAFQINLEHYDHTTLNKIVTTEPNLLILDASLQQTNDICRQVRNHYRGAILILSNKDEEIEQILALEFGADDYQLKATQKRLLLARINALLRQHERKHSKQADSFNQHNLYLNNNSKCVKIANNELSLSASLFDLLWLLANHAGEILDRDFLYQKLFNVGYDGFDRSIDVRISKLRKLLSGICSIKTIRGKGYLFIFDDAYSEPSTTPHSLRSVLEQAHHKPRIC